MFEEFTGKFYYLLHPRPTVVVGTLCPNRRANFMPASWNTPVSEEPPTVAIAIDSYAYTRECLDFHGEATLNILELGDAQLVYDLGSVSGREVDKVSRFRLELVESSTIAPPGLARSIAILESRVIGKYPIGETYLYVLEVTSARVRKGVADRFGFLFTEGVNIPLHASGRYFYGVDPRKLVLKKGLT
ncbi:MAG: flavin reductase family protein [Sulfolobales archaeon]|nr:flavin reductase family protein [Sulfolobales archaeon]MCX8208744.1 flavin reductase family protein [Sulfolobales archaeon]MDW8010933.1 flavin reductase family protein [Sulfolobales archaeon]